MIDPVRHRQLEELDLVTLGHRILSNARNELYLNMRFLDVSLSSLAFESDMSCKTFATDGWNLYYHPEHLCRLFQKGRVLVNRSYLHIIFHGLFCHMYMRKKRMSPYWNLACDIAAEALIDSMYQPCTWVHPSPYRKELYARLRGKLKVFTAEGIYRQLQDMEMSEQQYGRMAGEFFVDDHQIWDETKRPPSSQRPRQEQWEQNRERMELELELYGDSQSDKVRTLSEQLKIENRQRYDYKKFLRKFAVWREEIEVDPDSFDYVFYTYGLSLYGNMPLIEPQETREAKKIEEFVIVIDTSMSCSGELVSRFLQETYSILSERESYFKKIQLHIMQCDDQVRSDQVIQSLEELELYRESFTVTGQGGTDFRPAFEYVNQMVRQHKMRNLRGLIYFTDGKGIYPVKRPVYDTAFVFLENEYMDISVPLWAVKLIIGLDDLEEYSDSSTLAEKRKEFVSELHPQT